MGEAFEDSSAVPVQPVLKRIRVREQRAEAAQEIQKSLRMSPVTARILAARGFQLGRDLQQYLDPTLKEGLPDPRGLKGLEEGAALVAEFVRRGSKIAICCDFDVDGLSSGSQVYDFLRHLGVPVKVFVPDRFVDGYGLNSRMVQRISEEGYSLLIALDFGTTNEKELSLARELGLKTVVIDHHVVAHHKPGADVFINPQQPGCGFAGGVLCASGLAWFFLLGLKQHCKDSKSIPDVRSYLDLACLGTICDMVPLLGPNRVIARRGLELLSTNPRLGLAALKKAMGARKDVGCSEVSFGLGPRLNAAGRMVHGELVVELLTTQESDVATRLAQKLNKLNVERQETELVVKERAMRILQQRSVLPSGLVVWHKDFHTGVVGIVAQRLVETYYRPAVVLGYDDDGVFKGSVRGIRGFNVVESLASVGQYLIKFGGHEGAGGLSLKEDLLPQFAEAFEQECAKRLAKLEASPYVDADTEVGLGEIAVNLVDELKRLSPFGMGNPQPVVVTSGLKICDVRDLKGMHLKVLLSDGPRYLTGFLWRHSRHPHVAIGARVKVAYRPDYNSFQGTTELQANIQAIERE